MQEWSYGDVDAAFARGREEGLAAGQAEFAAKLEEVQAAAAAHLAEERAAWSSEEGGRLGDLAADTTWAGFASRNADLLAWKPSILDRYYRPETLLSERARLTFLLLGLGGLGGGIAGQALGPDQPLEEVDTGRGIHRRHVVSIQHL